MTTSLLNRRTMLLGATSTLGGCSAVSALNSAAEPVNTYDLTAVSGSLDGRRTSRTLLVVRPDASAVIATDRIMVKPDAQSVTYLPDARWSDELPALFQSLLIRSISGTGRIGYVGRSESGPVPDTVLLVRLDAFNIEVMSDTAFDAVIDIALTALNDRDQTVRTARSFARRMRAPDNQPVVIVATFQELLDDLLPDMSNWAVQNA